MKNNTIFSLLSIILCTAVIIATFNNYAKVESLQVKTIEVNENIEKTNRDIEKINFQLDKTDDLSYIEEYVREKFGFVKANEVVFIPVEE